MIEATDLFREIFTDLQTLEFRAKRSAIPVACVMLEGSRRGSLDMIDLLADIRDVLFEAIESPFAKFCFVFLILLFREIGPVAVVWRWWKKRRDSG